MTKRALKAKRSAAARKGWETRRKAVADPRQPFFLDHRVMLAADIGIEPRWWSVAINADSWKDVHWGDVDWGKEVDKAVLKIADDYRGPAYGISLAADISQAHAKALAVEATINEHLYGPNPWPRLAAKVRRWWQRATQWWRQ